VGQVRKIKAGLVKISVNDFVGEDGNIFFDVDDGVMRLSDGATPGGIPLSAGGGEGGAVTFRQLLDTPSSFTGANSHFVKVNPQASALEFVNVDIFDGDYNSLTNKPTIPDAFDPSSIDQSLLPDTDISYDLGSSTKKWRDLYLSGTTIYLGDSTISRHTDGGIVLPANSRIGTTRLDSLGGVTSYNDLTDKPTIPSDVSHLTDTTNLLSGAGGGSSYTLPIASNTVLGGIKIGAGLSINGSGVVSVTGGSSSGIVLSDLSVTSNAAGTAALTYDNTTGVFSYTPPDLSAYQLSANAFSGAYADLTGTPTLFSGAYADLTGTPTLFSGAYADLTGTPTIPADVSDLTDTTNLLDHFSGSYNDLTDKPTIPADVSDLTDTTNLLDHFSGSYNDLTDKPTIPTVPTVISAFTNDSGYITGYTVTQADVTAHQTAIVITESQISDLGAYLTSVAFADLTATPTTIAGYGITDAFDGAYTSLTGTPTIPTDVSDLTDTTNLLAGSTFDGQFSSLLNTPTTISGYGITDAFDGAYSSLTGAPTTVSSFTNDLGYLTTVAYADLTGKPTTLSGYGITDAYTNTQVDTAISTAVNNVLGGAPALLDTLDEIAAAVGDDPNFVTTINNAINLKANTADLHAVATSGDYNDLINVPTIPEDVADLEDRLNAIVPDLQNELYVAALIMG